MKACDFHYLGKFSWCYTMTSHYKLLWQSLLCTALILPTAAAKTPTLSSSNTQQELQSALDNSGFQLEMTGSQQVFADNRLLYTVSFQNTGFTSSSGDIDITSPVPPRTVYIPDSAHGENCDILFSADGGNSWGAAGQIEVKTTDGNWRTATARDYTHIKWLYRPQLRPTEIQQVSFQVVME